MENVRRRKIHHSYRIWEWTGQDRRGQDRTGEDRRGQERTRHTYLVSKEIPKDPIDHHEAWNIPLVSTNECNA